MLKINEAFSMKQAYKSIKKQLKEQTDKNQDKLKRIMKEV